MDKFRCVPIPTETAERFRRTCLDDNGNQLRRTEATGAGMPCRHCLHLATPGEEMLLGSYHLPRPRGIYWTPSPIFVHATQCPAYTNVDVIAPTILANGLVSVRAYDAADLVIYDLGHVCAGADIDWPLERALGDVRTEFVSVHTARPGCLLCRVERA